MPTTGKRSAGGRSRPISTGTYIAMGGVAVVIVASLVIALVLSGNSGDSDFDPAAYSVQMTGSVLPNFTVGASEGREAPRIQGTDFAGNPIEVSPNGQPTLILFLAHWCSHCQAEVRLLEPWLQENGMPQAVRVISVATAIDRTLPNYPPDEWLADWPVPVIVDDTQDTIANFYGLSGFPYWVMLDGGGTVAWQYSGELGIDDFERLIQLWS